MSQLEMNDAIAIKYNKKYDKKRRYIIIKGTPQFGMNTI